MNKHSLLRWISSACLLVAMSFLPTGCDDPDTSDLDGYFESHPMVNDPRKIGKQIVNINPSSATISTVGGKIVFRATGGSGGYSWDVSNPSIGTVTPSGDSQGVYVSDSVGANEVIVYDRDGNAAIAYISGSLTPMSIAANPATLTTDGTMCTLTVTGGVAPFTWSVYSTSPGNVLQNTGTSVPYRRDNAGDNAVTVTDSTGNSVSIIIKQP
jgi:hypothetical protein